MSKLYREVKKGLTAIIASTMLVLSFGVASASAAPSVVPAASQPPWHYSCKLGALHTVAMDVYFSTSQINGHVGVTKFHYHSDPTLNADRVTFTVAGGNSRAWGGTSTDSKTVDPDFTDTNPFDTGVKTLVDDQATFTVWWGNLKCQDPTASV